MVPISKINDTLDIYQGKNVIIWGDGKEARDMLALLTHYQVAVSGFVRHHRTDMQFQNLPLLYPEELPKETVLIQFALPFSEEVAIRKEYEGIFQGVEWISCGEAQTILQFMAKVKRITAQPSLLETMKSMGEISQGTLKGRLEEYMVNPSNDPPLLLCLPTKTGDHTLIKTFEKHGVSHHFMHHSPDTFDKNLFEEEKVKVITAVRDPIAKFFSMVYDEVKSLDTSYYLWACGLTEENFMKEGGDAQLLFDRQEMSHFFHMPLFLKRFAQHFLDITAYPFDQEKGYSIMEEGNIQVFVYQLERMNDILPALSEFVGCELTEYTMGNEASSQWIGEAYARGKEEVKINSGHYENMYTELWLEHFYSQEDIDGFRQRWEKNVVD